MAMETTPKAGTPLNTEDTHSIGAGVGEGDCVTPPTSDQPSGGDSPWWRVLQDALGNLVR